MVWTTNNSLCCIATLVVAAGCNRPAYPEQRLDDIRGTPVAAVIDERVVLGLQIMNDTGGPIYVCKEPLVAQIVDSSNGDVIITAGGYVHESHAPSFEPTCQLRGGVLLERGQKVQLVEESTLDLPQVLDVTTTVSYFQPGMPELQRRTFEFKEMEIHKGTVESGR